MTFPRLLQTVLDTTDARGLAEFYRQLLGWQYRPGDEPPAPGSPDPQGSDWLVLRDPSGAQRVAFQAVDDLPEASWPDTRPFPQQSHLDLVVYSAEDLAGASTRRAASAGPQGRPAGAAVRLRRPGRPPVLHLPGPATQLTPTPPSPARRGPPH